MHNGDMVTITSQRMKGFANWDQLDPLIQAMIVEDALQANDNGVSLSQYIRNIGTQNIIGYAQTLITGFDLRGVLAASHKPMKSSTSTPINEEES